MTSTSAWQPTITAQNLQLRGDILWSIRKFFYEAGFIEVHTPVVSQDTVIDRHIDPVVLSGKSLGLGEFAKQDFYLQTSPEFGMKRLLANGAQRIYQISQVFRAGERGKHHNPEFTMIEWYRVADDFSAATKLLADMMVAVNPVWKPKQTTYQQAFIEHAGICPLTCAVNELAAVAVAKELGVDDSWSNDRDDWLNLLFSEVVQPRLGFEQPEIVTHYPASQSALAKICESDSRVAERFELFIEGIELANGYHELLDAAELSKRNASVSQQRLQDGKEPLPQESRLLQAMRHGLPACSGCALGLDRLLMVLSRAKAIDEVICFPIERC